MITCWSAKGGAGTSTVVASIGRSLAASGRPARLVDLVGDLPAVLGVDVGSSPGIAEWLETGPDVPDDALDRLALPVAADLDLVVRGRGPFARQRLGALGAVLAVGPATAVVDAGTRAPGGAPWPGTAVAACADRRLLVVRACPVSVAGLEEDAHADGPGQECGAPTGVVVVRDPGRRTSLAAIARAAGAPVVAELDLDPAVGAAADAGLARAALPRRFLRALEGLA